MSNINKPNQPQLYLVFSTFSSIDSAKAISYELLQKKLCACVNILPGVTSMYPWQGRLTTDQEVFAIYKTTAEKYEAFANHLQTIHPYSIPEIVALPCSFVTDAYLSWVRHEVSVKDAD